LNKSLLLLFSCIFSINKQYCNALTTLHRDEYFKEKNQENDNQENEEADDAVQ